MTIEIFDIAEKLLARKRKGKWTQFEE